MNTTPSRRRQAPAQLNAPYWSAVQYTLARRETRWNLQDCPTLANRSQPLVGRSSPYYDDMWRRYYCLTIFFSNCRYILSCEDIARQSCALVSRWRIIREICVLYFFQRATCSTFQTCILNSHYGHTMYGSMANIQSATAEMRRGKRKKKKKIDR